MNQTLWERVVGQVASEVYEAQLLFLTDPGRYVVCCGGRQIGKDFISARMMLLTALEKANAEIMYVAQTLAEARRIMWQDGVDGLPAVARSLGIPFEAHESRLELTLDNGSLITLIGLDRGGWEKVRGSRLDLLVVTELQKANDEGLKRALTQVIPAALAAKRGRFVGIGTPEEFGVSVLHGICNKRDEWPQFSVHHWNASQNDKRPDIWLDLLDQKARAGMDDDDPRWLREGLGLWARQDDALILPLYEQSLWDGESWPTRVMSADGKTLVPRRHPIVNYGGLDFGGTDPSALVVMGWDVDSAEMRQVYGWKSDPDKPLDTDELYRAIAPELDRLDVRTVYCDNARPETILKFQRLHPGRFVSCDKTTSSTESKELYIREMRAALRLGRLKVIRDGGLHEELKTLSPDPKEWRKKRISARPGAQDHLYDAARYCFRGVWSNRLKAPATPMTPEQAREAAVTADMERRSQRNSQRHGSPVSTRRTFGSRT